MKDIKNAIEEEQCYLQDRLDNKKTSLINRLIPYGYNSLDEYFDDKRDYQLKNVNYKIYSDDAEGMIVLGKEAFEKQIPYIFIPTLQKTSIWLGVGSDIDRQLCSDLGLDIFEVGANGGTIVTSPDDFSFEVLFPDFIDVDDRYFLNKFYNFYKKYFDDVVIDGNDILINGVKIQGSGSIQTNEMFMFMCQVSFVDNVETINKICTKNSGKQAGCIDTSVLTKEMIYEEVLSWLQEQ